jgi:hypothetical protein
MPDGPESSPHQPQKYLIFSNLPLRTPDLSNRANSQIDDLHRKSEQVYASTTRERISQSIRLTNSPETAKSVRRPVLAARGVLLLWLADFQQNADALPAWFCGFLVQRLPIAAWKLICPFFNN